MHISGSLLILAHFLIGLSISKTEYTANVTDSPTKKVNIGVLLPFYADTGYFAAFLIGVKMAKARGYLYSYDIKYRFADTNCNARTGMKNAVKLWTDEEGLDGVIGPGCSRVCGPVGLLTAAWNLPEVSYGCVSNSLSDKRVYPTFTRVLAGYDSKIYLGCVLSLMELFNWTRISIVSDTVPLFKDFANSLQSALLRHDIPTTHHTMEPIVADNVILKKNLEVQRQIVKEIKSKTRVVLLLLYQDDIRNFLISAYDENMLNGEYAFLGLGTANFVSTRLVYRPEFSDVFIKQGLIAIIVDDPQGPAFAEFIKESEDLVASRQMELPGMEKLNYSKPSGVGVETGLMCDAVLLLSYGMNKTIEQGYSLKDGIKVTSNIINSTIEGVTGTIKINQNGDLIQNFKVVIWQEGQRLKLLRWNAFEQILEKVYRAYDPYNWSGVIWPGNGTSPPTGVPVCGWQSENCKTEKNTFKVSYIIIICIFIFAGLIAGTISFKRYFEKHYIEANVIPWSSITPIENNEVYHSSIFSYGTHSVNPYSTTIRLAMLNTSIVFVKPLCSEPLNNISRLVKQELHAMKCLQQENINPFMGICLGNQNIASLMIYQPRGSLFDQIHKEVTKLTSDIKISIVTDVAKEFHGHLTSHNCVISRRWICKITDYGLNKIKRMSHSSREEQESPRSEKLLWTSPELLTAPPGVFGTQPGDVYSFGVIVQELISQKVPYGANDPPISAVEVIERLTNGDNTLRPVIPPHRSFQGEYCDLILNCLNWDPTDRPTFVEIVKVLEKVFHTGQINMVDKMTNRLESHTKNLETVVNERKRELKAEKVKMEYLLKELLPASVAEDLTVGKTVQPEHFESVTIFFSDIVSFTKISAKATPMEVVRMLNLMYTMFDDVSSHYDVYKVATIGDAYFLASGVPVRNEDNHAVEIAEMALELLGSSASFVIPHLPEETLRVRVGIHSGSCVAGVVGVKTPRYLLFGETVDTASRMESSGEAMHIHVSETSASLLMQYPHLKLTERHDGNLKGLPSLRTYWLEGIPDDVTQTSLH